MIELGNLRFESQQRAKEFIQKFLRARGVCTILPKDDMFDFLADLIARHPEHGEKEPQGFMISRNAFKNLELVLIEQGGKASVFSFMTCLRGKSDNNKLSEAMREAVKNQIITIAKATRPEACQLCFKTFSDDDVHHVDHVVPFATLKRRFIEEFGKDLVPTVFRDADETGARARFMPEAYVFEELWRSYHQKHAKLRVVHAKCNLTRGLAF